MDRFKSVMLKVLKFVRTVLPIISVAVFGLCWLANLINSDIHGHTFDGQPRSFWNAKKIISDVMLINSWIFAASFSAFMLVKPMPKKHKALRLFLRILIAVITSLFFLGCTYLSLGAFYGFGG